MESVNRAFALTLPFVLALAAGSGGWGCSDVSVVAIAADSGADATSDAMSADAAAGDAAPGDATVGDGADATSTADGPAEAGTSPACTALPPVADDAGRSLITDFSQINGDGGPGSSAYFGAFSAAPSVFGGGTYAYPGGAPAADSFADAGAGIYCTTLGSKSTFGATATPGTGFVISGEVATFSGVGLYLNHCIDASAFHGIEFTISGDVGNEALDAGSPNQITFSVPMLPDLKVDSGPGNTCTLASCSSPSYTFTLPPTPTTMRIPWEMLTGGAPIYVLNPSEIAQLQWSVPWPCTANPTPYATQMTIRDVAFF